MSKSGVFPNLFLTPQQSSAAFNNNNTKNPLLFTGLSVQVSDLLLKAAALPVSQQPGWDWGGSAGAGSRTAEPAREPRTAGCLGLRSSADI